MSIRMLGAILLIGLMMMAAVIVVQGHSAADEPYVDGPLGPAMIMPPDPSKPIDVNTPAVEPTKAP